MVLFVVVVAGALSGPPAPPASAAGTYDFSAVDTRVSAATTGCTETCGAVVSVLRRGALPGTVDLLLERGWGDKTPASPFWTASAGKWFSAATVMSVVDDGLLSLDDTVGAAIPVYAGTEKGGITLRMLMSHTSGFGGGSPCMNSSTVTLAACADEILALPLYDAPGTRFRYGGLSMQVAGRMVELATGKPWSQVFAENVAGPLGLSPTTTYGTSTNPRIGGGTPGNGFQSVAADYRRLLEMMLGGGVFRGTTVLSSAAFITMTTDQTGGVPIASAPIPDMKGYGIGLWIEQVDAGGHGTLFTSPGAYGMEPWFDAARGYAGLLEIQKDFATGEAIVDDIRPAIDGQIDLFPAGTPPPVVPQPVISSVSPNKGPLAGGQTVTITGSGFTQASGVSFTTSLPASSFTIVDDTTITAVTPPRGTTGAVNVFVSSPGGVSATSTATLYTYVAVPTVTALSPTQGPTSGGTVVTITGTAFGGATGVRFGPDTWAPSFTVVSSTTITAVAPARPSGLVNVFVQTPGGLSASGAGTTYAYKVLGPLPVVSSVAPTKGPAAGGNVVTLTGTGFTGTTGVRFGPSTWASSVTVVSDARIDVVAPARAAGLVNVFVLTPSGLSATSSATTYLYQ